MRGRAAGCRISDRADGRRSYRFNPPLEPAETAPPRRASKCASSRQASASARGRPTPRTLPPECMTTVPDADSTNHLNWANPYGTKWDGIAQNWEIGEPFGTPRPDRRYRPPHQLNAAIDLGKPREIALAP